MNTAQTNDNFLNERVLASRLHVSVAALRKWRREGTGPAYLKLGSAVRYDPRDVAHWITARKVA